MMYPTIVTTILDNISDRLLVLGEEGQVVYANKVAQEILGCTLAHLRQCPKMVHCRR